MTLVEGASVVSEGRSVTLSVETATRCICMLLEGYPINESSKFTIIRMRRVVG